MNAFNWTNHAGMEVLIVGLAVYASILPQVVHTGATGRQYRYLLRISFRPLDSEYTTNVHEYYGSLEKAKQRAEGLIASWRLEGKI